MKKWNQTRCSGGRHRTRKPHSLLRSDWSNPRLKSGIFMLPYTMDSHTTNNPLEGLNRVSTIYTLWLKRYMVSSSLETSPSSMRTTTVVLGTGSGYNIFRTSALPLCRKPQVCPDYKIPPGWDANGNFLQTFSAVFKCIPFKIAVFKTILLVAEYFNVGVLTRTRFMNFYVTFICCCIDGQVEFTKSKILLLEKAPNELTVKELESIKDNYCGCTTDTSTTKVDYYSHIMCHKVALCEPVRLPPHTRV